MHLPRFWILGIAGLLFVSCVLALSASAEPGEPPIGQDWIVTRSTEFEGKTGYVDGFLRIEAGATLTLTDAVLTVNLSVTVHSHASLVVQNSTIKLDCTMDFPNIFEVMEFATCTIYDRDSNKETQSDASHITSTNDIPYNFTVNRNSTFSMRYSIVSKCGRPFNDDELLEGFVVRANDARIIGTIIRDGYFGLFIDAAERVTVENVTITDCYIGLYMLGPKGINIRHTEILNNTMYGAEIRGFIGDLRMDSVQMSGNGDTDLRMVYVTGYNNLFINCSYGPSDGIGMDLEEIRDTTFAVNRVTGCAIGLNLTGGELNLNSLEVTHCAEGVIVTDTATVRFTDMALNNTTIDVDGTTDTNISFNMERTWEDVTGTLACDLVANAGGSITMESCHLGFEDSGNGPTGLFSLKGGELKVANSTIHSPTSQSLVCHLADGSLSSFFQSTFSNLGTSTANGQRMGMYLAGSGTIEEVTLSDSLAGLVVGLAQTNIINLTIKDCETGIITDGSYGKGGISIRGLDVSGCDVAVRASNDGSLSVVNGRFTITGEGFNLTTSSITLKDSWVSDPTTGGVTAALRRTSTLDLVNTVSSRVFDVGPVENAVNIIWYLNLTLKYLSDGSPLSEALVAVKEASGLVSDRDVMAGADGIIQELELRERTYTPDMSIITPHTITVTKGALEDSFTITVEGSMDHVFHMDNYPPVLRVNAPEDGSLHNVSTITFRGVAWDAVVTATDGLAMMRYRVDDGAWTPIELPVLTEWTFDALLDDGFHVVLIQVHDRIGNMNSTAVSLTVDTRGPTLTITSPEEGLYTKETEVTVEGMTDPNATVTVDGVPVEVDAAGAFNRTVTLADGENLIVIVATDAQSNSVTRTRTVTLDTQLPVVVLDQDDLRTNQLTFEISGTKKANATIYVDGYLSEFFASTRFSTVVDLPEEGLNDIHIWSEDLAGNNYTTTILIERDTTPPSLIVGQLPEFTNKDAVTVQGSTNDSGAVITVNGEEVTMSGLTFAKIVLLTEGPNTITVQAVDDLGNQAEPVVMVVTLDTTVPPLTIDTPKFVETFEAEQELEGSTDPGLHVSVNVFLGLYSKTYNLVAGPDGSFNVTVALPQVGNHTITITVINEANNQATDEVFFVRHRQDPVEPPEPPGDSWLSNNWAYLILVAALVASAAIWMFTLSAGKRRREGMARARAAQAAAAEDEAEWDEEDGLKEDGLEEEGAHEEERSEEEGDVDEGPEEGNGPDEWEESDEGAEEEVGKDYKAS